MREPRITIRDVAREAGVSITTVSDALNGRGRLPDATRGRVQQVARRLGYRASPTARRLRRGRTSVIGLYCPLITNVAGGLSGLDYYMRLAIGAAEEALTHELALTLLPPRAGGGELAQIDVDGLVAVDPTREDPALRALVERGLPIVTCEYDLTPGAAHAGEVSSDHRAALAELLDHLQHAGAKRIALVAPAPDTSWGAELQDGYRAWSAAHGREVQLREVPIATIEHDVYVTAVDLLDHPRRPDAIVSAPEGGALGVLRAARERDLTVPDDLLVASCVDSPALAAGDPPITAIDLRPQELGRTAARLLAGVLDGRPPAAARQLVATSLRARRSTQRRPALRIAAEPT